MSPESRIRLHTVAMWIWLALAIGTTIWGIYDPENKYLLAWVIFMSGYANVASHWSAREGAAPSAGQESLPDN